MDRKEYLLNRFKANSQVNYMVSAILHAVTNFLLVNNATNIELDFAENILVAIEDYNVKLAQSLEEEKKEM